MQEEYTREEILQVVDEEDVQFIRLQFTDMFGNLKNVALTARELPAALEKGFVVDASHIAGIAGKYERNLILHPDPSTFAILPWRPRQGKVARLLCDICYPDGTPHPCSTRHILRRVVDAAAYLGYRCFLDPECEFFLFHTEEDGTPTTLSHEKAGYMDISPVDLGENARRDMVLALEDLGIEVVSSHHETAPAQHEISVREGEAFSMADCVVTLKTAIRTIAKTHGLHATFMPKPLAEVNGSGMHVHFRLLKDGKNVFAGPEGKPQELSREGLYFIGGLLAHSREMALITNPVVNSYKRLVPGFEAPTELTWAMDNTNSLIRIPYAASEDASIELRSPDGASNPYLVFAVCLAAGLDGIEKRIQPQSSSEKWTDERGAEPGTMPSTLMEAAQIFEKSEWIQGVLGKEFCRRYLEKKKKEWLRFSAQVTQWELEEYLYRM